MARREKVHTKLHAAEAGVLEAAAAKRGTWRSRLQREAALEAARAVLNEANDQEEGDDDDGHEN